MPTSRPLSAKGSGLLFHASSTFITIISHFYNILLMSCQSEIMELSGLSPLETLETVRNLLDEGEFEQFTLIYRRKSKGSTGVRGSRTSKVSIQLLGNDSSLGMKCLSDISCMNSANVLGMEDSSETAMSRGMKLYNRGEYLSALRVFKEEEEEMRECLKEGAEGVKAYRDAVFQMGNCYYRLKEYEKAVEHFGREFKGEEARQRGQKHNNLASCYAHLNQPRLSLKNYSQALKIYSDFPQVDCSNLLSNLGMLYAHSSMYETAERYFLKSIEERNCKSPENFHALYTTYLHLGNCQKHSKRFPEAIGSLQVALGLAERGHGNEGEVLMQLANLYELLKRWKQALDCYQKLSQRTDKKGLIYQRAAHIHNYMGHSSDFHRFLHKAYDHYKLEQNDLKAGQLSLLLRS